MSGKSKEQPKVVMRFDEMGGVAIDAQCFVGAACKEATKAYEEIFVKAGNKSSGSDKPELFGSASESIAQTQTQRM